MYIEEKQVFNLMDTNGRRSDVLNAFNIYLQTLVFQKNFQIFLNMRMLDIKITIHLSRIAVG